MTRFNNLYAGRLHIAFFETFKVNGKLMHLHVNASEDDDLYPFHKSVWPVKLYPGCVYASLQIGDGQTYSVLGAQLLGHVSATRSTCQVLQSAQSKSLFVGELESALKHTGKKPEDSIFFVFIVRSIFGDMFDDEPIFKAQVDRLKAMNAQEQEDLLNRIRMRKFHNEPIALPAQHTFLNQHFKF